MNPIIPPATLPRDAGPASADSPMETVAGTVYVLGLTQFALLALGIMALNIIVKVDGGESGLPVLASHLVHAGLWLFLIPLTWILLGGMLLSTGREGLGRRYVSLSGCLIIAAIIICFGVSLLA